MTKLKDRIKRLETDVEILKQAVINDDYDPPKGWNPTCPLCSSRATRSTTTDNTYCCQENGACGELWAYMPTRKRDKQVSPYQPDVHFRRTTTKRGQIYVTQPMYDVMFHLFFIGGVQVEKEEYELT